jgi:hypothetical protein
LLAGFKSSLEDQLKQILEITGTALKKVNHSLRTSAQRAVKAAQDADKRQAEEARTRARIRAGTWHDPRLDCIAGNGIISELGVGDELLEGDDSGFASFDVMEKDVVNSSGRWEELAKQQRRNVEDVQAVRTLPIVVIKNYATRGGVYKEELLCVLAHWAASLTENQVIRVAPLVNCVAPNVFRDCPCYRGQRQPRERKAAGPRYALYLYPYEILLTWRCSVAFKAIELYCPL